MFEKHSFDCINNFYAAAIGVGDNFPDSKSVKYF